MVELDGDRIGKELDESGLTASDIRARPLESPERAATGIPHGIQGYVIPYFDLEGKAIPFYRVKAFDFEPKYKQIKNAGNYVYLPRGVKELIHKHKYVIITEGEKKAACAVKNGFPCIGLGGVDSWRNRTFILPEGVKLNNIPGKDRVSIKMSDVNFGEMEEESTLAHGLQSIIDFAVSDKMQVILCFDSDIGGVKFGVQRSIANFAFELRYKGVTANHIKQLILPIEVDKKWGIDDYIMEQGTYRFGVLVDECLAKVRAFPQHPNILDYIAKRVGGQKLLRKEAQQVAIALLADMDTRGMRLRNKQSGGMYFFDNGTRMLMDASLRKLPNDILYDTEFTRYLWRTYGIGHQDQKVLQWMSVMFTSEEPIGEATPYKVIAVKGDTICYQINDGQYIAVNPTKEKPLELCNNGTNDVLFESGIVQPLDGDKLMEEIKVQLKDPMQPLWPKVLQEVRLKEKDNFARMLGLLFYLSPWINRWRGTQLPIEMALGEPGSGKSSLYETRLGIIIGSPDLRNAPGDLKDWYASISSTGGIHVTDNVQLMDKSLRQRLSDEMCRLVTEPFPHVEMRRYFTNSDLIKLPIYSTFAITAVQQPFHNADLMQRSIIIEFDKGEDAVDYLSKWSTVQIERFGGRIKWLAHHLTILHKFLNYATTHWDVRYRAKYRLMNVEQSLMIMARILGMDDAWIPNFLSSSALDATRDADWAFEGICAFTAQLKRSGDLKPFAAQDIAEWAASEEEYNQCNQLTNGRSLGRYIQSHKQMLAVVCGLRENGKYGNRATYIIDNKLIRTPVQ